MQGVRLDMIGNLQTNKINQVVGRVRYVHSVASAHLANAIAKRSCARDVTTRALLEVNVSGEESKGGCAPQDALELVRHCCALPNVRPCGLMTMAPQGDVAVARTCFERLAALENDIRGKLEPHDAQCFAELSMGMSEDWRQAIAAGSTMVRIGRAIFSETFERELI
jgi:pyridoxal phosphate enzyme (YggS family)